MAVKCAASSRSRWVALVLLTLLFQACTRMLKWHELILNVRYFHIFHHDETSVTQEYNDTEYCATKGSLHQMCLDMIAYSSPPGSPSFTKTLRVLHSATHFQIDLGAAWLFNDNESNIATMLKGFGLHAIKDQNKKTTTTDPFLHVESVVSKSICESRQDCSRVPRILVQTEQLIERKDEFHDKLKLCHESELCIIWEFSDFNYRILKDIKLADSVVLIPIMIQSRLGDAEIMRPLQNRSIDVSFFATMTERRQPLRGLMNETGLETRISQTDDTSAMKKSYQDSKVCLIMHAYNDLSSGETHRLSEMGRFGCIPVLETWADTMFVENYKRCGDVVFAGKDDILNASRAAVKKVSHEDPEEMDKSLRKRVEWWRTGIDWARVLNTAFRAAPGHTKARSTKAPFVTFIIPTKFRDTLNQTIASLTRQTSNSWEAILGIDVQNIDSDHVLESFGYDPRLSYMLVGSVGTSRGKKLNGAGEIRNKMVRKAKGEWVAFLDDDDTVSPHYVEWLQNSVLRDEQIFNKKVDLVLFRMKCVRSTTDIDILPPWQHRNRAKLDWVGISFAVRKRLFTSKKLAFETSNAEDYDFLKAAYQKQQKGIIQRVKIADCVAYFVKENPPPSLEQIRYQPEFCNLTDLIVE